MSHTASPSTPSVIKPARIITYFLVGETLPLLPKGGNWQRSIIGNGENFAKLCAARDALRGCYSLCYVSAMVDGVSDWKEVTAPIV